MSDSCFEIGATCLGVVGNTATWRRTKPDAKVKYNPMVIISECSASDDGVYSPASSVTIGSVNGLIALRDAIDEALRYSVPQQA